VDSGLEHIPMCTDAAWISRLFYRKWMNTTL
jgi:hypothetical protein